MASPRDLYDLSGRVAVVTGAGSGIGRATALLLGAAGATVVCADLNESAAELTAKQVTADGGRSSHRPLDVAVRDHVFSLVDETLVAHGRIDVMANVAGIMHETSVLDCSEADLDRVLGINLKGVLFGVQAAGKVMATQGWGSIVNMSSGAIDTPAPNLITYAIAKAGVAQLTRTAAVELGPKGVRVNAIAPGFVMTAMTSRHFTAADGTVDEARKEAVAKGMGKMAPLGRVGDPADIAAAVLYLASDASSYVTGQILRPNGGVAMPW